MFKETQWCQWCLGLAFVFLSFLQSNQATQFSIRGKKGAVDALASFRLFLVVLKVQERRVASPLLADLEHSSISHSRFSKYCSSLLQGLKRKTKLIFYTCLTKPFLNNKMRLFLKTFF